MEKELLPYQHLKIQLEEIIVATNNFDDQYNCIGVGGFGKVYRGEVSHSKGRSMAAIKRLDSKGRQGVPEFLKEITMLSKYKHENLVSLLGFCCEGSEMILVYELASRGSLDRHLNSPNLSWMQRLKICLDVAKGLSYLHDPRETHQRLIHCDMKSGNILLDDQWNAKVSDFGLSIMGSANEQQSLIVTLAAGTRGYCDPQYAMTNTLTKESDVYSFGVVLFEVLTGRLCCTYRDGVVDKRFVPTWIESYEQEKLNDIIFKSPTIPPLEESVLKIFSGIAYRCLEVHRERRPMMAMVVGELKNALKLSYYKEMAKSTEPLRNYISEVKFMQHLFEGVHLNSDKKTFSLNFLQEFFEKFRDLKIQLEEIISATNNFDDQTNRIGVGGFGKIYKGMLTHSKGRSMVAIKRLDRRNGQGTPEFLKEITMLSMYKHENLISLLGFCCEGSEMILVYELASRGSLDRHLNSFKLTWAQRLKICLDAAKGLSYLHDPRETHQRLIHCDMKSGNILLDDQWNAKVSDFGLSIMGSANEQQSVIVTLAAGTRGYCDPQYAMTHTLTKESDIYSFGVILFEVLTGRLCCTYNINGYVDEMLVPMWIKSYKQKNLEDIVFKNPSILPLDQSSLEIFSDIAYQCLKVSREDRPNMDEIVAKLEAALQMIYNFEESMIFNMNYRSNDELMQLLSKGVLLSRGKTWFSLNKKGEHCEMRSFVDCVESGSSEYESKYYNSRFVAGTYRISHQLIKTRVETQFLSPGITYTVNLVFKFILPVPKARKGHKYIELEYKLGRACEIPSLSYLARERKDGWWMCELCQLTSDNEIVGFDIVFEECFSDDHDFIEAEGIEFWPLEKVEHTDEIQPLLDLDANWEEKLPSDYEDMMKWSTDSVQWTTKKEVYSIIHKGFLIDDGKKWLSLDKNGKKCHMLSATYVCSSPKIKDDVDPLSVLPLPESRFGEVVQCNIYLTLYIDTKIPSQLVSPQTTYASYLVYKWMPELRADFRAPFIVKEKNKDYLDSKDEDEDGWYIYLSPQTPVLRPKAGQNTHNPSNRLNIQGLPRQRDDGWTEVQIWEFETATNTTEMIPMSLELSESRMSSLKGLIIQGIDFKPM